MRFFRRSQDHNKMETGDIVDAMLFDVISLVISILVGVIYFFVTKPEHPSAQEQMEIRIDIIFSVMFSAVLYLVLASLSRTVTNLGLIKRAEIIIKAASYRNTTRNTEHDLIFKMSKIVNMDELIGKVGISSLEKIVESIKITDQNSGWSFPSQAMSLKLICKILV